MKKKWYKRSTAVLLAVTMVLSLFPGMNEIVSTVHAAENTVPTSGYFTDVNGLNNDFNVTKSGTIGRIKFGDSNRLWAICGTDADGSLALLSTSAFQKDVYGKNSAYSTSNFVTNMSTYLGITYFSIAELDKMANVTVSTDEPDINSTNGGQKIPTLVSDKKMYLPNSKDTDSFISTTIYVGSNNDIVLDVAKLDDIGLNNLFWLRSPRNRLLAFVAEPGLNVSYCKVSDSNVSVVPAFNLDLSSVVFASAANAASSSYNGYKANYDMEENTFTLRYASDDTAESAVISPDGTKVEVNVSNTTGKYLMVQNSNGVYAKEISEIKQTINAKDIQMGSTDNNKLSNFNNCKVWVESTSDRITTAKMAVPGIGSVAVTDITAPAVSENLDTSATCTTTGATCTTPTVTWVPNDATADNNRTYTANVTLTADDNYAFASDITATVNGQNAKVTLNQDGTITVSYTFGKTAAKNPVSSAYYATVDDLKDYYNLISDGTIGKIKFGTSDRLWAICGVDADGTLALLSTSEFAKAAYCNNSAYSTSNFVNKMNTYLGDTYFSTGETGKMTDVTVKTNEPDIANGGGNIEVTVSDKKLYLPNSENQNSYGSPTIYVGSNNDIDIDVTKLDDIGLNSHFWLRSPYSDSSRSVLVAVPGYSVNSRNVKKEDCSVVPAFNLDLSSVLFASAANAATSDSGALTMSDANIFTLRYAPAEDSDLVAASAEVSYDGSEVAVSNVKSGMYLVVQKGDNAYAVALEVADSQMIQAKDVTIGETALTSFDDCKVWIESTDNYRITTAAVATKSMTPSVMTFEDLSKLIEETEGKLADGTYTAANATASVNTLTSACEAAKQIKLDAEQAEITTAYNNLENAIVGLVPYTATVTLNSNPSNSGILTGGGRYAVGDEVQISAKAVTGYTFDGWYAGTDGSGTLHTADTKFTYIIKSDDTDVIYIAKYTANVNKKLTVTVGNGIVDYSYNKTTGTWMNDATDNPFAQGTYFTVTAKANDSYTFLYWIDTNTKKVLTTDTSYSFYLSDDVKLQACYRTTQTATHYVVFKDMDGMIIWSGNVNDGAAATDPGHGIFTGYSFTGWSDTFDNITNDKIILAIYQRIGGYTITANGGTIVSPKDTYTYGDFVTVQAEESDGSKYFSGWYEGDTLVSADKNYSFYVIRNTGLTAKYEGDAVIVPEPLLNMTMSDRTNLENGKQTIQFNNTWSVPDGYSIMEAGLVFTLVDSESERLTVENADNSTIYKKPSVLKTQKGTYAYTLTLSVNSKVKNVNVVGYLTYVNDATGEIITRYTFLYTSNANES